MHHNYMLHFRSSHKSTSRSCESGKNKKQYLSEKPPFKRIRRQCSDSVVYTETENDTEMEDGSDEDPDYTADPLVVLHRLPKVPSLLPRKCQTANTVLQQSAAERSPMSEDKDLARSCEMLKNRNTVDRLSENENIVEQSSVNTDTVEHPSAGWNIVEQPLANGDTTNHTTTNGDPVNQPSTSGNDDLNPLSTSSADNLRQAQTENNIEQLLERRDNNVSSTNDPADKRDHLLEIIRNLSDLDIDDTALFVRSEGVAKPETILRCVSSHL